MSRNVVSEKFFWRCSCGKRIKSLIEDDTCNCKSIHHQKRYYMTEATCNLMDELETKIKILETALWYFGNHNGPDIIEELQELLPEKIWTKLDLKSIERTNGDLDD